jgi:hypothetical protein
MMPTELQAKKLLNWAPVNNNMLYFTKYAEKKFEILNRHKIFFTREQIEDAVKLPDKIGKKSGHLTAEKDGIKVIYKKDGGTTKVITFYPVKQI